MIVASFLQFPLLLVRYNQPFYHLMILDLPLLFFSSISVFLFYGTAVWYLDEKRTPRMVHLPLVMALGIGLAFSNAKAVLEAVLGVKSEFVRTPKYSVEKTTDETWKAKKYKRKRGFLPLLELGFAVYFALAIWYAAHLHMWGTIPFLYAVFHRIWLHGSDEHPSDHERQANTFALAPARGGTSNLTTCCSFAKNQSRRTA